MKFSVFGAGFVGKNFIQAATLKNYEVKVLSRSAPPDLFKTRSNLDWIEGDFSNKEDVSKALSESDIAIHLVSNTVPGDKVGVSQDLFYNVENLLQFLDLCLVENVKRVIFASSASVYGETDVVPVAESVHLSPISTHAIQKITLEYYLKMYKRIHGLDCKIMRLSNPYGPFQDVYGRQGFISIVMGNILKNRPTIIFGKGETVRDFIHIDSVVSAMFALAETTSPHSIFNIGQGVGISLLDTVGLINKIFPGAVDIEYRKRERKDDIPVSILDIKKAEKYLKFKPELSIEEGLRNYMSYLKII